MRTKAGRREGTEREEGNRQGLTNLPQVKEIALDYTECVKYSPEISAVVDNKADDAEDMPGDRVSSSFGSAMVTKPKWGHFQENFTWPSGKQTVDNICVLVFTPPENIPSPILFYYRLTNFYQNHRRYVKSFDSNQLKGTAVSAADIKSGDCDPLAVSPKDGRPYYPCGLIANSLFNDTYENLTMLNAQDDSGNVKTYNFTQRGIVWSSEGDLYGETKYEPKDIVPPPFWAERYPDDGYDSLNKSQLPQLHTDEAFQVWMRTAGLPTFSKLAQRNDVDTLNGSTSYRLKIHDRTSRLHRSRDVSTDPSRLSRAFVRRNEVDPHLDSNRHGWQEHLPGHRLRCRGRSLHLAWHGLHPHPSCQAKVCPQRAPTLI